MTLLRVAMIAPPWLPVPPVGYGGIENVLAALVPELIDQGIKVELFATGDSTLPVTKLHWLYKTGQYNQIHKPQYDAMPISIAHLMFAVKAIRKDGGFDIIHDHNGFLGPMLFANSGGDLPPAIHTLHGPPFTTPDRLHLGMPDNLPMWRQYEANGKLWIVPISKALVKNVPAELKPMLLNPVHNMINADQFPFVAKKDDYFITLGRFSPEKGQHLAVKACLAIGAKLRMAGAVAGMTDTHQITKELAKSQSQYRNLLDFRYYGDEVFPYLNGTIVHVGEVMGEEKLNFISKAKALLFPIEWDEPFGMVVLEALACGTPVIAMRRGAMPEIIEHGVNGFLADNFTEFKKYIRRVKDIDPAACRQSVERKFSAKIIAKQYISRYRTVIAKHKALL